jgi:hypothetical protein
MVLELSLFPVCINREEVLSFLGFMLLLLLLLLLLLSLGWNVGSM